MAAAKKKKKRKTVMFRGKPLYRIGDRIFYGNLYDKYILVLDVLDYKEINGFKLSTRVRIQIMDNQQEFGEGQIYRKSEKENMYKALDIGAYWLKTALAM